jgi:voltage-gated potassium channel
VTRVDSDPHMAHPDERSPTTMLELFQAKLLRKLLEAFATWSRHALGRLTAAALVIWFLGAYGIYVAERGVNPSYRTWFDALWNVWLLLFSGLEDAPQTVVGRVLAMVLVIVGVALMGFFTATVASVLVERYLERRHVTEFEMDDHLILCNWDSRGLDWIREVHSRIFQQRKRPVVIIHDQPERIDLPDKADEAAFSDVYIVKGDPTNEIILRRAKVQRAYSVVILADEREGKHADGKSILTCIALRGICREGETPNVAVECRDPANRKHLLRAGADDIISSDELGLRMLARAALFHGMSRVYQELLTVGRDANELYLVPVPEDLVGMEFAEVSNLFVHRREDRLSCILMGIQRDDEMILNPIGDEAGPLQKNDQLILLSRVVPGGNQPLPYVRSEQSRPAD